MNINIERDERAHTRVYVYCPRTLLTTILSAAAIRHGRLYDAETAPRAYLNARGHNRAAHTCPALGDRRTFLHSYGPPTSI